MGTTTEKLTYLQGTKDTIKNAIVAKGVEVPEGTTFRGYAEKVGEIPAGAKTAKVTLEGYNGRGQRDDSFISSLNKMYDGIYLVDKDGNVVQQNTEVLLEYNINTPSTIFLINREKTSFSVVGAEMIELQLLIFPIDEQMFEFGNLWMVPVEKDITIKYYGF